MPVRFNSIKYLDLQRVVLLWKCRPNLSTF